MILITQEPQSNTPSRNNNKTHSNSTENGSNSQDLCIISQTSTQKYIYFLPNLKHLLCLTPVILGPEELLCLLGFETETFSIALINLRKCLMYSGYVSMLQWPPPWTHNGSYFSFASSHNLFPCEKSTMSSFVPCHFK